MNILVKLTQYKAEKARIDRALKALEESKAEIVQYMEEHGTREVDCTSVKAVLTECRKVSLDEKAIRAELPEVAEKYNRVTVYDRFSVK